MRAISRVVIVVFTASTFPGSRHIVTMLVSVVTVFVPMPLTRMFFGMFTLRSVTSLNDMSMLTRVSMMRAAPKNGMQQHRRHRQNAGQ